uniref:Zinc finger protein 26 n=1 Tax=Culex pipiens TaxID=7175 RepID=A0A8D8I8I6_CULPI
MEYALDMDVHHTCRICLSQPDQEQRLFSLFSSAIVDGFLVSIPEAISFCVDLEIVESAEMPGKICQSCKSQMLNFYAFKRKCKRTEQILQETIAQKRSAVEEVAEAKLEEPEVQPVLEEDEEKPVEEEDGEDDNLMFEIAELVQCESCDKMFENEEELKQHAAAEHFDVEVAETPEVGDDELHDDTEMGAQVEMEPTESQGLTSEHGEDVEYYEEIVSLKDFPEEAQEECAEEAAQEDSEDVELMEQTEEPLDKTSTDAAMTCNICGANFVGQSRFGRHMRSHEATAHVVDFFQFHICCDCKKVFLRQDEYLLHLKSSGHVDSPAVDTATSYVCGICPLELAGKLDDMKLHILIHQEVHSCPLRGCGCEYASLARLGVHIRQKHVEHDSLRCQHCGMDSFDSTADLQQHLRLKCTGKKFPCNHCDKKFLTQRSLANHLKTIEKRFRCDQCGKSFAQQGELKLHQRFHNGERPYQCTVCGKSYKSASLRTAHMDSHIEGKTFQCQICDKQLQTRTCYRNHLKRHSEEKKHECDVCSKKFYTKYHAKIHKEKVHKPNKAQGKAEGKLNK